MNIVELDSRDKFSFNQFIAKNNGSFLQSWEWGDWQEALGRKVFRYAISEVIDSNAETVGSMQIIKMPLPFNRFYLYCPYGPVFSAQWAVNSGKLIQEMQRIFSDAVFVRVEPKANLGFKIEDLRFKKSKNIQPGKTLLIDLSKTEEQILSEMHHKTRYNIKLAKKHGVEIKDEFSISIGNGLFAKEAVELIVATGKRQGYKGYGVEYYQKLINYLGIQNRGEVKLHIYKAIFQNQLLASAIMIDFAQTRTFLFGGSSEFHKNVMAPYLLHFQAMMDAKMLGLSRYDFWGIETSAGETPGFVRFKLGFSESSDAVKEYGGAYDLVIKSWEYKIYNLLRNINKVFKR